MPITAIIAHTRHCCWPTEPAQPRRSREQQQAYMRRYMREVYRKTHPQRSITLSQLQERRLCAAAALHGRRPNAFLREAAFAYLDRMPVLPAALQAGLAALTLEVRRIGTNINQLAHQANADPGRAPVALGQAIALLAELEAAPARFLTVPPPPHAD